MGAYCIEESFSDVTVLYGIVNRLSHLFDENLEQEHFLLPSVRKRHLPGINNLRLFSYNSRLRR